MKSLRLVLTLLFLSPSFNAFSQSPEPSRTSVMKNWDVWLGDWILVGTAKDDPSMPELQGDMEASQKSNSWRCFYSS